MDIVIILALVTFGCAIAFGIWSKSRAENKLEEPNAPTSSLARETPDPALKPRPEDPALSPNPDGPELRPDPDLEPASDAAEPVTAKPTIAVVPPKSETRQ